MRGSKESRKSGRRSMVRSRCDEAGGPTTATPDDSLRHACTCGGTLQSPCNSGHGCAYQNCEILVLAATAAHFSTCLFMLGERYRLC